MQKRIISTLIIITLLITTFIAVPSFGDTYDTYRVYYNNTNTGYYGYYVKSTPYLPISMIGTYAKNEGISLDEENMKLVIDLSKQVIMMADDETTAFVKANAGTVYIPLKDLDGTICFPLNTTSQFFSLSYSVNSNSISLRQYSGTDKIATVSEAGATAVTSLIEGDGSSIDLAPGERVFIKGETSNYYKLETMDSQVAYALKSDITVSEINLASIDFYAPKKNKFLQGAENLSLAWQYVASVTPEAPAKYEGLDILAPTWFDQIVEGDGNIENNGDRGYVDACHENGYMVWATITNNMSTSGSTKFTTKVFGDTTMLNKTIAQYIFYACLYNVDGLNIDYEDVSDSDAQGLVNFTKKLRVYTEKQGLNLSIDTLIPKPWTIEYDRDALAKHVDYIALMTYDEHYSSSPAPGSIASLPWVEEAVVAALDEGVPSNKLLLGIPLYTRVWCLNSSGNIVSNKSATMDYVETVIEEKGLSKTYLSSEKQNYVEYADGDTTAKIWIEDSTSIANRLYLVNRYNLAGSACWQFEQGSEEIWDTFSKYL